MSNQVDVISKSGFNPKQWKLLANVCLWVGFAIPFVAGNFVGMSLTANVPVFIANIVLWVAAYVIAYKTFIREKGIAPTVPGWIRVCNYINSDSPKVLLSFMMFGYLYHTTLGAKTFPNLMPQFLAVSLFVMGLTIKTDDWKRLVKSPKAIGIGVILRWAAMPLVAVIVGNIVFGVIGVNLGLPPKTVNVLIVALILLGTSPTGTASNALTFLAGGDVALSVSITSFNTLISPFVQPVMLLWLAGSMVDISAGALLIDLVKSALIPVILGTILGMLFPNVVDKIKPILAPIAIICLGGLMMTSMAKGTPALLKQLIVLPFILVANLIHGCTGFAVGYFVPKLFKLNDAQRRAICFEVAVENVGLTQMIASTHFAATPLTLIPSLLYGKLQNFIAVSFVLPMFKRADMRLAAKEAEKKTPN